MAKEGGDAVGSAVALDRGEEKGHRAAAERGRDGEGVIERKSKEYLLRGGAAGGENDSVERGEMRPNLRVVEIV
ncbi:hypothetical protein AMTR_s00037p00193330 [Amborella trichopoda]|uniref:Uncharacterized protein n=1 Tax=Amborella trichopoda TaxID=13333 RepID=U5CVN3_AMBTC|nr:hypothetical protein AMTR_s00037p00193330 [Amborella trichopoda]